MNDAADPKTLPALTRVGDAYAPLGAEREWRIYGYVSDDQSHQIIKDFREVLDAADEAEARLKSSEILAAVQAQYPGKEVCIPSAYPMLSREKWGVNLWVGGKLESHFLLAKSYQEAQELAPAVLEQRQRELGDDSIQLMGVRVVGGTDFIEAVGVAASVQRDDSLSL